MTKLKGGHSSHLTLLADRMERDLSAIHHAMRKSLNAAVAKGELTGPQTAVMRTVLQNPGLSLRDLSREVSLAQSTVSGIVDRLQKRGLLLREPNEGDKRVVCVRPSTAVTEWVDDTLPALKVGPLQAALQRAQPDERETLAKAVARLRTLLSTGSEPAS